MLARYDRVLRARSGDRHSPQDPQTDEVRRIGDSSPGFDRLEQESRRRTDARRRIGRGRAPRQYRSSMPARRAAPKPRVESRGASATRAWAATLTVVTPKRERAQAYDAINRLLWAGVASNGRSAPKDDPSRRYHRVPVRAARLLARLAALVPRPRSHLIPVITGCSHRMRATVASSCPHRRLVVPAPPPTPAGQD